MIPRILHRLSDVAIVALFGLDADRAAMRGLAEQVADGWREIGHLNRHLREARRIAHEQEDRAERAEALAENLSRHLANAMKAARWAPRWKEAAKGFRLGRLAAIKRADRVTEERDAARESGPRGWEAVREWSAKCEAERAKTPSAADVDAAKDWAGAVLGTSAMPADWTNASRQRLASLLLRLARVSP